MRTSLMEITSELPHCPGVYHFYSGQQYQSAPIYIGKSIDIKKRVCSHIYSAKNDTREWSLMSQVKHITYQKTAGEFGALLLEAGLVKRHLPAFNKRLRKNRKLYYLTLAGDDYLKPVISEVFSNKIQLSEDQYGLFRSRRHARVFLEELTKEHGFCRIALGLEHSNRACFAYQLKRCRGACVGVEDSQSHNQRLLTHFQTLSQQVWPFRSAIRMIERSEDQGFQDHHLIDQWRYLGCTRVYANKQREVLSVINNASFDIDYYRIICKYLLLAPDYIDIKEV